MNKIKRWYYKLTKQTRIAIIMAIIGTLYSIINFYITYSLGRLPKGPEDLTTYIDSLLLIPCLLFLLGYSSSLCIFMIFHDKHRKKK